MKLELLAGCAFAAVEASDWRELLTLMGERVVAAGHAEATFTAALLQREANFPTGLPTPIPTAIPHADPQHLRHPGVAVATVARPVEFAEMGGSGELLAVRAVVLLAMTDGQAQVDALQAVLARLGDQAAVAELLAAGEHAVKGGSGPVAGSPAGSDFEAFVQGWLAG